MTADTKRRPAAWAGLGNWYRPAAFGLTVLILVIGAVFITVFWQANAQHTGEDLVHYLDGVRRWWTTGSPYLPWEVAAPFDYEPETFLHTPVSMIFFAPWFWLPPILWWAIPIGIVVALVVAWRPAPWTWPLIAFGLAQPQLHQALLWGNTNLWLTAALAVALIRGPWAVAFLVKPSLVLFAVVGMNRRSWWSAAAALAVVSVPFGHLWVEWVQVVLNSPGDVTYGVRNFPWVAIPAIAWMGSADRVRPDAVLVRARRHRVEPGVGEPLPARDVGPVGP